jgi:radical SAM superfamily enzyme YgiQ (UPF0313 family)
VFDRFKEAFDALGREAGKRQSLVPYFISSFPGAGDAAMAAVEDFLRREGWTLEQVQDYIPLPMTPAAAMYVTGRDYDTGSPIPVTRGLAARRRQMLSLRPGPGRR